MDLKLAEHLARQRVQELWPELAATQPIIAPRRRRASAFPGVSKLTVNSASRAFSEGEEITFTFAGELRTPEGDQLPTVARVTVRGGDIVRATISR